MEILNYIKQNNCYVGQNNPRFIVIHETDNTNNGAGAKKHGEAHKNGNLATSVHYYVDDTYVVQTLNHKDGAWAVGTRYGTPLVDGVTNKNSINIEICVNPDSDYEKARLLTIELVKKLMKDTGISASKVIRHYDAKKKYCPRKMLDNGSLWTDFKNRLTQTTTPSEEEEEMEKIVTYFGEPDAYIALLVSHKLECPLMKHDQFVDGKYKAKEVIQIGGTSIDTNRYVTAKNACEKYL